MKYLKKIKDTWKALDEPIYVDGRLKANLTLLTIAGLFTAVLSIFLIITNYISGQSTMVIGAIVTFFCGALCAFFAGVLKNRKLAALVPTLFCGIVFTIYLITAAGVGTGMLWTLIMPIGMCYFVSVKYGVILSTYFTVLFFVVFYTPLGEKLSHYYTATFMMRFPIVFVTMVVFTTIAMMQYHRMVLFEIKHTGKLSEEVKKQTKVATDRAAQLAEMNDEIVLTLAMAIDAKDNYTNGHSFRVAIYSMALARQMGWPEDEVLELGHEALLHDIGKIGVPDIVLNKPGRLTDDEFQVIKSHAKIGGDILAKSKNLQNAASTARHHHERYDGKGYPDGLSGCNIPKHARVVSIADSYDAMHSDRIYRKGLANDIVREELIKGRGTQFDPDFVDSFLLLFDSGELFELDNIPFDDVFIDTVV